MNNFFIFLTFLFLLIGVALALPVINELVIAAIFLSIAAVFYTAAIILSELEKIQKKLGITAQEEKNLEEK